MIAPGRPLKSKTAGTRLLHISLTARDAPLLAAFYSNVFGFSERRAPTVMSGPRVSRGNGLPGSNILSIWLNMADPTGPFLEILQYTLSVEAPRPAVNAPGFGHLAFAVDGLDERLARLIQAGGSMQGKITDFGTPDRPSRIVYCRDPEGNILELEEQST